MKQDGMKRSVDSLQKIYAVIIALAINESIKATVGVNNQSPISSHSITLLVSFFALVVPFYHGMNRHLDICYLENPGKNQGALIFDFIIFCLESSLLFVFVKNIPLGLNGFLVLAVILFVDMIWGAISHLMHYQHLDTSVIRWTLINIVTLIIGIIIYYTTCLSNKAIIFMVLSLVRTIADYGFCWKFYFPPDKKINPN